MRGGDISLYDAREIEYELFDIFDQVALFTDKPVHKKTVPAGIYVYDIRHGEDGDPATLEKHVVVNFYGTVILNHPVSLGRYGCRNIECDDYGFYEEDVLSLEDFMKTHPPKQQEPDKGR